MFSSSPIKASDATKAHTDMTNQQEQEQWEDETRARIDARIDAKIAATRREATQRDARINATKAPTNENKAHSNGIDQQEQEQWEEWEHASSWSSGKTPQQTRKRRPTR